MVQRAICLGFLSMCLWAQSGWRESINSLPERPGSDVTADQIERVERDARMAAPYFASLSKRLRSQSRIDPADGDLLGRRGCS
jgi:hypothetical protein